MSEINSSSPPAGNRAAGRAGIIDRIGEDIMRWQDATQDYDEAVGLGHQLGPAERRCLSVTWAAPQPAGAIATATGLTPAAVTALIDRLEARGLVRRQPDPSDRRRVLVAQTEASQALVAGTYLKLAAAGHRLLESYSDAELATVARFLADARRIQEEALAALAAPQS